MNIKQILPLLPVVVASFNKIASKIFSTPVNVSNTTPPSSNNVSGTPVTP